MLIQRLSRLVVIGALVCSGVGGAAWAQAQPEVWKGAVQLPGGAALEIAITVNRGDEPSATIDIPSQGAIGVPLHIVSLDGTSYVLTLPPPANAEIAGTINDQGDLAGLLKQAGLEFPFKLVRAEAGEAALQRPQTPKPPFPYTAVEVRIPNPAADGVVLAGTLLIPEGAGPFPVAILVSGSGPQDRDESLLGHKPFLVLADSLARRGIAVLRCDDRGVAGSTGDFAAATTDDFASDALAIVNFARQRPEINPAAVGIIGHSEGGLIAPMAASQDSSIGFLVLLAGMGVNGAETLVSQQVRGAEVGGAPEAMLRDIERTMSELVALIAADAPEADLKESLRSVFEVQAPGALEAQIDQLVADQVGFFASPWMRRLVMIEPAEFLSQVTQPTLALFGGRDVQVVPEVNVEPTRAALAAAPAVDVTVLVLDGHNHLFQRADTGLGTEYAQIQETISPKTLDLIGEWIEQRFLR